MHLQHVLTRDSSAKTTIHNHNKQTTVKATVMDTATASLENKPLKETEGPLDDVFPAHECGRLAAAKHKLKNNISENTSQLYGYKTLAVNIFMVKCIILCCTCLINSSSCSTNDSNTLVTSALNLKSNNNDYYRGYYEYKTIFIQLLAHGVYLSVSSSVMMTLSLNFGSALLSHQNLCVFFLCSGLKPRTFEI